MGKIIVIGSQKGGVGKTTTTLNLAYSLKELGKKVLTVDFDSQANLTTCYGVEDTGVLEYTIGHLMMAQIEEEVTESFEDYIQSRDGVDYLPSSIYLSVVDAKLRTEMGAERMLAEVLEPLKSRYDYILIDTCPSLGMLTINALAAADEVIITVNPQLLAMMGLQDFLRIVGKIKKRINPKLEVAGILLTMCESRTTLCTLEKVYGIKDVLHLHGGIPSCCEIAPIMGHGNKYIIDLYRRKAKEAQEEYVEWYESICNAIADFCESLYKDTDAIISENDDFFSALRDVNQVVCLGLSFGDVDVPYLDRIEYEVRPETKWLVYYHSDEDLKRLKSVFGITGISRKFEVYFRKSDNFWDR